MQRFTKVQKRLLLQLQAEWRELPAVPLVHRLDELGLVEVRQRSGCVDCGLPLRACRCERPRTRQTVEARLTPRGVEEQQLLHARDHIDTEGFLTEAEAQFRLGALKLLHTHWRIVERDGRFWVEPISP